MSSSAVSFPSTSSIYRSGDSSSTTESQSSSAGSTATGSSAAVMQVAAASLASVSDSLCYSSSSSKAKDPQSPCIMKRGLLTAPNKNFIKGGFFTIDPQGDGCIILNATSSKDKTTKKYAVTKEHLLEIHSMCKDFTTLMAFLETPG